MSDKSQAPVEDFAFLLHDVFGIEKRSDLSGFSELTPDVTGPVLQGLADFVAGVYAPLNASGDEEGCRLENGIVRTPRGFADAYRAYCEAGWNRLGASERFGGAGLPGVVTTAASEIGSAANVSLTLYSGLTGGAASSIGRAGAPWMLEHIVPHLVSGKWCGTMCLTEPGCGTDLRLMKTRASRQEDGSYRINGTKIFISGGDHDMVDNIVHLVLAKLPDAEGRYGEDLANVALFMVPKFLVDIHTGETGGRNGVSVGGVEKKMGLKGSATCMLNFENAVGHRLGSTKANAGSDSKSAGMSAMFDMMNYARLGTGVQALATAQAAYVRSAEYARQRRSGRSMDAAHRTAETADPIIVHPDVRRMLMKQRAFIEGARALALWVALQLDIHARCADREEAARALELAQLLTPVVKAYFSDAAFQSVNLAVQVHGGHGYIRDNHVEQSVRDARIFQLYEGANGIQALDFVMRKLPSAQGRGLRTFVATIEAFLDETSARAELKPQLGALRTSVDALVTAVRAMAAAKNPNAPGAGAYDVLNIAGVVGVTFMWAWMGRVALDKQARGGPDSAFCQRKLALGRYWAEREAPVVETYLAASLAPADTLMEFSADAF